MKADARLQEAQINGQIKMAEAEAQRQVALINREVELTKLAAGKEVNLEKIRGENSIKKYEADWNIKAFYEELKLKKQEGETANYGLEADDAG